jgi:hypothetical protein
MAANATTAITNIRLRNDVMGAYLLNHFSLAAFELLSWDARKHQEHLQGRNWKRAPRPVRRAVQGLEH